MSRGRRVRSEFRAEWYSFVRQRTAVFFTFLFPVILIVIFGALVQTTGGGLFTEPPAYYVPGYLAVVVLFTPLSRISSSVTRARDRNQFEKLATTPLTKIEWLIAHSLVSIGVVSLASLLVIGLVLALTPATVTLSGVLVPFIVLGTAVFCGLGAIVGRVAGSRDGAIAASNAIGLPLLFLSDTFVPPALLPAWFQPVLLLSPLTYFARGTRAVFTGTGWEAHLVVLLGFTIVTLGIGAYGLPWRR